MATDYDKVLKEKVVPHLQSLEDTIIFMLIERAQFGLNYGMHMVGEKVFKNHTDMSYFDGYVLDHELADDANRYETPEEVPFSNQIQKRMPVQFKPDFYSGITPSSLCEINLTHQIRDSYMALLGDLCLTGEDEQYGSTSQRDLFLLQTLSERIHYGSIFVAECKLNMHPEGYTSAARRGDEEAIMDMLTVPEREEAILNRVRRKVIDFQKDTNPDIRPHVDAQLIVDFYRDVVIKLTKDGELSYIMQKVAAQDAVLN